MTTIERGAWAAAVLLLLAAAVLLQVRTVPLRAQLASAQARAEHDRAAGLAAAAQQEERFRSAERRQADRLQEIQHDHDTRLGALRADRDRAAAAAERLRAQLAHLAGQPAGAAPHQPTAIIGPATDTAAGVLADLLGQCVGHVRSLAAFADAAHVAGQQCERGWDVLSQLGAR